MAALAHGAGPIRPVDKIVGPGNAYVTAAKRRLYGVVGIDALAGPSEIVVVASGDNDPDWIAADLLSQAEHDPGRPVDPDHRRPGPSPPRVAGGGGAAPAYHPGDPGGGAGLLGTPTGRWSSARWTRRPPWWT